MLTELTIERRSKGTQDKLLCRNFTRKSLWKYSEHYREDSCNDSTQLKSITESRKDHSNEVSDRQGPDMQE